MYEWINEFMNERVDEFINDWKNEFNLHLSKPPHRINPYLWLRQRW